MLLIYGQGREVNAECRMKRVGWCPFLFGRKEKDQKKSRVPTDCIRRRGKNYAVGGHHFCAAKTSCRRRIIVRRTTSFYRNPFHQHTALRRCVGPPSPFPWRESGRREPVHVSFIVYRSREVSSQKFLLYKQQPHPPLSRSPFPY